MQDNRKQVQERQMKYILTITHSELCVNTQMRMTISVTHPVEN